MLAVGLVAILLWRPWMRTGAGPSTRRTVSFLGEPIALIDESVVDPPGPVAQRVIRDAEILGSGEHTRLQVDLDDRGLAMAARYERPGQRTVELRPDGVVVVDGAARLKLQPPVLVIDVLHRVRLTSPLAVTLFEPASAETLSARIVREGPGLVVRASGDGEVLVRALPEGPRHGPGAFAEGDVSPERPWAPVEVPTPGRTGVAGLRFAIGPTPPSADDAVDDSHRQPGPFIESDDDGVRAFAQPLCASDPLDTARRLGEAIRPRVDATARLSAPGARQMLRAGGDCDGAATLAVAGLRACGHPARVVVGYVLVAPGAGARLVPHAVAEVYRRAQAGGSGRWWRLDPTVPSLTDHDDRFVPIATGPGGALSMGRVLGLVDERDLIALEGPDARP
jgi:transglutaminase-like putative cysteine protease